MQSKQLQKLVIKALEDHKALDITDLDIRELTNIADRMIICSGTSKRHVQSMADNVVMQAKAAGIEPLGVEGKEFGEWVLIDLGDVVIHIMLPQIRDFYSLEKLWMTTKELRKTK